MKVIVIDGGYLMHKGIFASIKVPAMAPQFLYLRMIAGLLKRVKYEYKTDLVILAHDGRDSWRKEHSLEYKSDRQGNREELKSKEWWEATYKSFTEDIKRYDNNLPFHFITIDRVEADDIASVCARYYKNEEKIIFITKDKDWHQLAIYPNVKVYNPNEKKYEVIDNPQAILDDKVESGDKSDHILGKCKTEEQRKNRILIMSLLQLPEDVELKVKMQLGEIKNKDHILNIEELNYPSVKTQWYKLFGKVDPGEDIEIAGEVQW